VGWCGNDQICTITQPAGTVTAVAAVVNYTWNAKRAYAYYDSQPGCPGYEPVNSCGTISSNNYCGQKWGRCTTGYCTDNGVCDWRALFTIELGNNNNNNNNNNSNNNSNVNINTNFTDFYNNSGYTNTRKLKAYDSMPKCAGYVAPNVCGFMSTNT